MKRQPNGRPRVYLGADGWHHCYVTVGTKSNGQPDRKHVRGRTAREVSAKVDELLARIRQGSPAPAKVETVGQWLEHWLENIVRTTRRPKTYEAYRPIVRLHIVPRIGGWRLDGTRRRLEPEHVEAMYADLKESLAPAYVRQVHAVLRRALKVAVRRGRAGRNVCDLIDNPGGRAKKVAAHSLDEAQAIVRAALDDPIPARWMLAMLVGLRQGEALGLRWPRLELDATVPVAHVVIQVQRRTWRHGCDDQQTCARERCRTKPCRSWGHGCADPAACRIQAWRCPSRVPAACTRHRGKRCPAPCRPGCTKHASTCPQRKGGGLVDADPKSERGERPVPLPPVVVELLRTHRETQIRAGLHDPVGYVFTSPTGAAIDPRRDHERWEQLLQRAGVPDSPLHAARHDAGTVLVATGADISIVQELLGHADIRTSRGYVDVAQEVQAQAVQRVAAALFDGELAALLQPRRATTPLK